MRLEFSAYSGRAKGPHWFSVMKTTLNLVGPPVGDPQLPVQPLGMDALEELKDILAGLGYQVQRSTSALKQLINPGGEVCRFQ
jgi:hypothetical protein